MGITVIRNATVIDGTGAVPRPETTIVIGHDGRISAIGPTYEIEVPEEARVVDASGTFVIPGLMDANVHLVAARTPDTLLEFEGRYEELAREAAELTLKYGVTTVFDTWGPAGPLTRTRDAIAAGAFPGSRIYCAGNIIGLGGPLSGDFVAPGVFLERETVARINETWERGVGAELGFTTVEEIGDRVAEYIETTNVDFIKWAATDHIAGSAMQYLMFSEKAQQSIAESARRYGKPTQAHTTTVDSLRISVDLEVDLLQHGDLTNGRIIPDSLLDRIASKGLTTGARFVTKRHMEWTNTNPAATGRREMRMNSEQNQRGLLARGARAVLASDGFAYGPRISNHPGFRAGTLSPDVPDLPVQLGYGHLPWIEGALAQGMAPMEALRSLTSYIAEAYGIADLVGTLEPGKLADLLVLEADPFEDHKAYAKIRHIFKEGDLIDRDALAQNMQLGIDLLAERQV